MGPGGERTSCAGVDVAVGHHGPDRQRRTEDGQVVGGGGGGPEVAPDGEAQRAGGAVRREEVRSRIGCGRGRGGGGQVGA